MADRNAVLRAEAFVRHVLRKDLGQQASEKQVRAVAKEILQLTSPVLEEARRPQMEEARDNG